MPDRLEADTRTVSLLTLGSRVTGLLRDAVLGRVFGLGLDPFLFAFLVPNLFRRLFGEGALASAFLPAYTTLLREDPLAARRLATLTVASMVVVLGVVVLGIEAILWALQGVTDGGSPTLRLTMITLPYLPLVCLVAVLGAILQARGRFGPTAAAPIILNACLVAAALLGASIGDEHLTVIAAAVVVAGLLQVAWSLAALRGQEAWAGSCGDARGALGAILRRTGPMLLGLGAFQLNTFLDGIIASWPTLVGPTILSIAYPLEAGALTAVTFAQRLYQFPLGVFGIAVATVIFPLLARRANEPGAFTNILRRGLRLVVFVGLPASAGLMLVRSPLASAIFEGGLFTDTDVGRVGVVLLGYATAIWAYSMVHVLTRAFYARHDVRTPVRTAMAMVVLNLLLNVTLIWTPLREAGLAWSTALCAVVQAAVLLRAVRRHAGNDILDRAVLGSWARTAVLTIVMVIALILVQGVMPAPTGWSGSLLALAVLVPVGGLVFAAGAALGRMPELRWALGRAFGW